MKVLGFFCPECKQYLPMKRSLSADLQVPRTSEQAVIVELACGHQMGTEAAVGFLKKVSDIKTKANDRKAIIDKETAAEVAAAWETLKVTA